MEEPLLSRFAGCNVAAFSTGQTNNSRPARARNPVWTLRSHYSWEREANNQVRNQENQAISACTANQQVLAVSCLNLYENQGLTCLVHNIRL